MVKTVKSSEPTRSAWQRLREREFARLLFQQQEQQGAQQEETKPDPDGRHIDPMTGLPSSY